MGLKANYNTHLLQEKTRAPACFSFAPDNVHAPGNSWAGACGSVSTHLHRSLQEHSHFYHQSYNKGRRKRNVKPGSECLSLVTIISSTWVWLRAAWLLWTNISVSSLSQRIPLACEAWETAKACTWTSCAQAPRYGFNQIQQLRAVPRSPLIGTVTSNKCLTP